MSAPRYAVETVRGNYAVLTENLDFGKAFGSAADNRNLEVTIYSPAKLLENYGSDQPLPIHDGWLINLTPSIGAFFLGEGRGLWAKLTTYPHPKLYLLEKAWEQLPLETPSNSTRIIVGEYLGSGGGGSPTLDRLKSMLSQKIVNLAEGGLTNLHLMSETYFMQCLALLCEVGSKSPTITLVSPDSCSLLTLVQHLQNAVSHSLTITFEDHGLIAATSAEFSRTTYATFDHISPGSTLSLALAYLQSVEKSPPARPQPIPQSSPIPTQSPSITTPMAHLKPLRLPSLDKTLVSSVNHTSPTPPRNLTEFEFVPQKMPHKKRSFPFLALLRRQSTRIVLRGVALGLIMYLGSLCFALGISLVTLVNLKTKLTNKDLTDLSPAPIAKLMANYLYSNAIALKQNNLAKLLDAYQQGLSLSDTASTLSNDVKTLATYILTDSGDNLAATLTNTRVEIENLYRQLSLLDGSLTPDTPALLHRYDEAYQSLKKALPTLKQKTLLGKGVASMLPDVIAVGGRAKYLVLFQNNMEQRATGGFIGSYGLVSFENGKLYDFQVYDVYSADGQLKGHVEPPEPIKKILGEAKWYLRDSNFDPDFPTSARRAEWFLKKSMDQDVQGTIAVNLETLRALLQTIGPLELADYNETVNASNLAERAQFHAEVNFFPGSTAKKEFLSSVGDALFQKLKGADASVLLRASASLVDTLESSDTMLSSSNANTEHVLQALGWNGELENKPCPGTPCYDDYLYQVDSNFGVNKANFYVTKETSMFVNIDKTGKPENTLTTIWKNAAKSNAWPAGSYKNYTRTYLPPGAVLTGLKLGETTLNPTDYTVTTEHGRLVIAYLVTVPIDSTTTSTLTYNLATTLPKGTLYSLYLQRQSGASHQDKLSITLNYPSYLKPERLSPEPSSLTAQQLVFTFSSDTDHRLAVQF